jgi:hypothetical protein
VSRYSDVKDGVDRSDKTVVDYFVESDVGMRH